MGLERAASLKKTLFWIFDSEVLLLLMPGVEGVGNKTRLLPPPARTLTSNPVSYTHLDVYKRQLVSLCLTACRTSPSHALPFDVSFSSDRSQLLNSSGGYSSTSDPHFHLYSFIVLAICWSSNSSSVVLFLTVSTFYLTGSRLCEYECGEPGVP